MAASNVPIDASAVPKMHYRVSDGGIRKNVVQGKG
jgi:hypothetical protein